VKLNGLILLLVIGASGCASQNVTIRSWPPETPAADNAANIAKAQELIAVSSVAATSETRGEAADAARSPKAGGADVVPLVTPADAPLGAPQPLHVSIQRTLRRSGISPRREWLSQAAFAASLRSA
jgi:hypothetical protein